MVGMASPIPSGPVSTDLQHCAPMAQNAQAQNEGFCGKENQTCSNENDLPANTLGKLMQVESLRTKHPGTGQVVALAPQEELHGDETVNQKLTKDVQPSQGPFTYILDILGTQSIGQLAFPLDVSELPQLPMAEMGGPTEGLGGTVVFFALLFLLLVCLLAVLTCFGENMDSEISEVQAHKTLETKRLRQAAPQPQGNNSLCSTTTTALSQQVPPASVIHTWSQPSSTLPSWQDSAGGLPAQATLLRQPIPEEVQHPLSQSPAQPLRVASSSTVKAANAQRPWESAYLPQVPPAAPKSQAHPTSQDGAEENAAHLPPMLTAFPPFWRGGPSPCADETPDEISVPEGQEPPSGLPLFPDQEADTSLPPFAFPNLGASEVPESGPLASDYLAFQPTFDPPFDPTSGTLCHWMMVDPSSECAMAVPIADQDLPAVSMSILALDQRPVLKAEVYRGQECEALPGFSPMIGDFWPPENVCLSSMERGTQRPSVVLTSLPMEIQRSDEGDKENVAENAEAAEEDIQILSACYLVRADEQSLEFDIYNSNGEFFGRMGRDHSRSCRFMMRGGNFGEVRYFVDGVFEDHAVLFTDMCQDTLADGEPFEVSDLPFPEAAGCIRLRVHGTQAVDAGLILTMLFCAYELRSLGA